MTEGKTYFNEASHGKTLRFKIYVLAVRFHILTDPEPAENRK
jgi:hypothetical protein